MAINVIQGGTVDSFDYLAFPNQNPANTSYIQNQLTNISDRLTGYGRTFLEASKEIYEKVNNSQALMLAKAAVRRAKGFLHPNSIMYLGELDDLRQAQPMMQRFIMAEPALRREYHKQRVDGYSDTYVDVAPGKVGEDHYDYRRVMTGVVTEEGDGEDYTWKAVIYADELFEGDSELDTFQKNDILKTWDIVNMFMAAAKDPTDPYAID